MATNKTDSNSAAPTLSAADKKVYNSFLAAVKASSANNSGNATSQGAVYTRQEGDAAVQSIYQQLFGQNAIGADYNNAMKAYLNQAQDTSATGRQQAIINYAMNTPEYKSMQEDKYLDAMYAKIQANVREVQS